MKAGELYSKTMPFVWIKLMLGLVTAVVAIVLFALFMLLAWLFNSESVTGIMIIIWVSCVGFVRFLIMQYAGYLVQAGHIAVMAEACVSGQVPNNQVEWGKAQVMERFGTTNAYFAVDKLVAGAVRQIQKGIGKIGNALNFMPGMKQVTGIAQYFVELSLGYIDECCLGYTFYNRNQNPFKSAADGVVIYASNWQLLLANAGQTMLMVAVVLAGSFLAFALVLGLIFRLFSWPGWVAFAIALLGTWAIKSAFVDSYIIAKTMSAYMGVAPSTVITFDLYGQLSSLSPQFKELLNKGQQGQPVGTETQATTPLYTQDPTDKPVYCGACGAINKAGTKFCGTCGAQIQQG